MKQAVLVLSYGTPERREDVAAYYTHIRRGNPPTPELLADLEARYQAIGGPTELNRITRRQAAGLGRELARRGEPVEVRTGFKHTVPFIEDQVARLGEEGFERVVGLVLAPHFSLRSIAEYIARAEAGRPAGLELEMIETWHAEAALVELLAGRLLAAGLTDGGRQPYVLFTAHSVPASVVDRGDPYPQELARTCTLVANRAGVRRWSFAYQSAGRTADEWLGPGILEEIDRLADEGEERLLVQAIGFVADNLEVLYDIDIEARDHARGRGIELSRTAMPNASPEFVRLLADIVSRRLKR